MADAPQHPHRLALDHRGAGSWSTPPAGASATRTGATPKQAVEVIRQPGGFAWTIFNETAHGVAMQFSHQREALEAGAIRKAGTFDRLAEIVRGAAGTPWPGPSRRSTTSSRDAGPTPSAATSAARRRWSRPYYAVKVTGALFHTQGGLVVDPEARVLRKGTARALPNLFAGGGAARGLTGPSCWGYTSGAGLMTATTARPPRRRRRRRARLLSRRYGGSHSGPSAKSARRSFRAVRDETRAISSADSAKSNTSKFSRAWASLPALGIAATGPCWMSQRSATWAAVLPWRFGDRGQGRVPRGLPLGGAACRR